MPCFPQILVNVAEKEVAQLGLGDGAILTAAAWEGVRRLIKWLDLAEQAEPAAAAAAGQAEPAEAAAAGQSTDSMCIVFAGFPGSSNGEHLLQKRLETEFARRPHLPQPTFVHVLDRKR